MLNFRGIGINENVPRYSNKTMVGNWWEDRYVPGKEDPLTTTERVFAHDLGYTPNDYKTTKMLDSKATEDKVPSPVPPKKPSLYSNEQTLRDRLDTYLPGGNPPTELTYTLGRNALAEAANPPQRHLTTTNKHFYKDKPDEARATHPEHFEGPKDRTHFHTTPLTKGVLQQTGHLSETHGTEASGKGLRGELTRNPREAGNPYGVSVFVDEYAQWGSKLAGKTTLGETASRKMTAYF